MLLNCQGRSSVAVHVMLLVSSAAIIALLKTASKISEPPCNKGGVIPWLAGRKPSWNLLAEVSHLTNVASITQC